jgi:hypothetical protein
VEPDSRSFLSLNGDPGPVNENEPPDSLLPGTATVLCLARRDAFEVLEVLEVFDDLRGPPAKTEPAGGRLVICGKLDRRAVLNIG